MHFHEARPLAKEFRFREACQGRGRKSQGANARPYAQFPATDSGKSDQRTRVCRNHSRSYFSSSLVIENFTFPRSFSSSCCAFMDASFFSATLMVSVTPAPV